MQHPKLLIGRALARSMRANYQEFFDKVRWDHGDMEIAVLKVGSEAGAETYLRTIQKNFDRYAIPVRAHEFPADVDRDQAYERLRELQTDPHLHGLIVLKPLPEAFAIDLAGGRHLPYLAAVQTHLDLECISPRRIMDLALGLSELAPPTAGAVLRILDHYQIPIAGRRVVVLGRSANVGRPVSWLLLKRNATVTVCHSQTDSELLGQLTRSADILVAATGRANSVTAAMVKPGAVVVDVGFEYVAGRPVGDVRFDEVSQVAAAITPVPGGVGPVTNELLAQNLAILVTERYNLSQTR